MQRVRAVCASYVTLDGLARDPAFDCVLAEAEKRVSWFRSTALTTNGWWQCAGKPSIHRIAALKKAKHSEAVALWVMRHGNDEEELIQSKITIKDLQAELTKLKKRVKQPSGEASGTSRADLIKALCTLRKQFVAEGGQAEKEPDVDWQDVDIQAQPAPVTVLVCMEHPLTNNLGA